MNQDNSCEYHLALNGVTGWNSLAESWLVWRIQDDFIHMPVTSVGPVGRKIWFIWDSFPSWLTSGVVEILTFLELQEKIFQEMESVTVSPPGLSDTGIGLFHSVPPVKGIMQFSKGREPQGTHWGWRPNVMMSKCICILGHSLFYRKKCAAIFNLLHMYKLLSF